MMATAFIGYVLPWGQMSIWGATVTASLLSTVPVIGKEVVMWLWGGCTAGNPTPNRWSENRCELVLFQKGVKQEKEEKKRYTVERVKKNEVKKCLTYFFLTFFIFALPVLTQLSCRFFFSKAMALTRGREQDCKISEHGSKRRTYEVHTSHIRSKSSQEKPASLPYVHSPTTRQTFPAGGQVGPRGKICTAGPEKPARETKRGGRRAPESVGRHVQGERGC